MQRLLGPPRDNEPASYTQNFCISVVGFVSTMYALESYNGAPDWRLALAVAGWLGALIIMTSVLGWRAKRRQLYRRVYQVQLAIERTLAMRQAKSSARTTLRLSSEAYRSLEEEGPERSGLARFWYQVGPGSRKRYALARIEAERLGALGPEPPPINIPNKSTPRYAIASGIAAVLTSSVGLYITSDSMVPRIYYYAYGVLGLTGLLSIGLGVLVAADRALKLRIVRLLMGRIRETTDLYSDITVENGTFLTDQREELLESGDTAHAELVASLPREPRTELLGAEAATYSERALEKRRAG